MSTASEEILARRAKYQRVEREVDAVGRTIGVRPLRPSQQIRVQELAPGLDGTTTVLDENGAEIRVPRIAPLVMAASVVEIDGVPTPWKTRADLDATLDILDEEGMTAVMTALAKFSPQPDEAGTGTDAAKN